MIRLSQRKQRVHTPDSNTGKPSVLFHDNRVSITVDAYMEMHHKIHVLTEQNYRLDTALQSIQLILKNVEGHYFQKDAALTKVGIGVVKVKNRIQELSNKL